MIPPFARWLVHWFMPSMRVCRKHLRTARSIIEPEISLRKKKREQMLLEGEKTEKPMDSLSWFLDNAKGEPFDYTMGQVAMGFAAIHTTSSMMAGLLGDLAENPDVVDQLRKEIAEVLRVDGGWKKTSLYKMKLLDSCMKESQRLHPITACKLIVSHVGFVQYTDLALDRPHDPRTGRGHDPFGWYLPPQRFNGCHSEHLHERPVSLRSYRGDLRWVQVPQTKGAVRPGEQVAICHS